VRSPLPGLAPPVVALEPLARGAAQVIEPHSISLTRGVTVLETRIVCQNWRRLAGGYRRLVEESSRELRALVFDPQKLTAYDRAVIHAVSLAHERRVR